MAQRPRQVGEKIMSLKIKISPCKDGSYELEIPEGLESQINIISKSVSILASLFEKCISCLGKPQSPKQTPSPINLVNFEIGSQKESEQP